MAKTQPPPPAEIAKLSIDALELSVRQATALRADNIFTVGDVWNRGLAGLKSNPRIGNKFLLDLAGKMEALGAQFPD
jgi:hypothetical protein